MTDISLNVTRIIKATRERVFTAWTDPKMITQWWGPGSTTCPEATVDLRVGGAIQIANKIEDGSIVWIKGEFEEIDRPARLIYSWFMGTGMEQATRVTVQFNDHAEGTELVLTHTRFANDQIRDAHLMGWGGCIDGLEALLA